MSTGTSVTPGDNPDQKEAPTLFDPPTDEIATPAQPTKEATFSQDVEYISKQLPVPVSNDSKPKLEHTHTKPLEKDKIPLPPALPKGGVSILAHKLWIGNLDKRLTEQNILKFVTQYGTVVSFRYLFKETSQRAEPRGYVFVEFSTREEAEMAKAGLDGKKALGRKLIVDWAKVDQGPSKKNGGTVSETWDVNAVSKTLDSRASKSAKIAALEAKLRQMEEPDLGSSAKRQRLSSPNMPHRHTVVTGGTKRTRPMY